MLTATLFRGGACAQKRAQCAIITLAQFLITFTKVLTKS